MSLFKDSLLKNKKFIDNISKKENLSKTFLWLNSLKCYIRYGATPTEWFLNEMFKYRHNHLRNIITRKKNIKLDMIFNSRELKNTFDNKYIFNNKYRKFIKRKWCFYPQTQLSEIQKIEWGGVIVVKPLNLSSGKGIFTFNPVIENWAELEKKIKGKDYLLEQRVENCPELKKFNSPSCNTFRIYTLIDSDSNVQIIGATLKIGGSNSIQDNFHSNGVLYPIDIEYGIVSRPGKDLMGKEYIYHPSSGEKVVGFKVPHWNKILDFVKDAALIYPKARFIGWDVALTSEGCEMIEGNYFPSCNGLQIFDRQGKYNLINSYK